jgi:copper chaperone CopZ
MSPRRIVLALVLLFMTPAAGPAELRRVSFEVLGMDCGVCAHAVLVTLRNLPGVEKVEVSLTTDPATRPALPWHGGAQSTLDSDASAGPEITSPDGVKRDP